MDRTLRPGDPGDVGMSPDRIQHVKRLCADWVGEGVAPALQVLVARRGTIVLHDVWGCLGPEADAPPLTVDSIFGIGSLTKPITAVAIMCLIEDGLLGLNRPVQEYVPEFVGEGKDAVMVHHLLTHTSGTRDDALDAHARAAIRAGRIAAPAPVPYLGPDARLHARCFDDLHDAPLSKAPGAEMSYCSYGWRLLREIVTRVTGHLADNFVQDRIFDPLGMASTSYTGLPTSRLDRLVRRLPEAPFAILNHPDAMGWAAGMGAAYSNAHDLATFAQMFMNGGVYGGARVLSRASVAEMTRNQIPGVSAQWAGDVFPEASWGYGWGVQGLKKSSREPSLLSPSAVSHIGFGMYYAWADPAYDLVGAYLSVTPRMVTARKGDWCADLFANAVTASVVD